MAALLALVMLGPLVFGIPITRRMARLWPRPAELGGADRVAFGTDGRVGPSGGVRQPAVESQDRLSAGRIALEPAASGLL